MFLRDRTLATTERVSVDSEEEEFERGSGGGAISGDGRYVAFQSAAMGVGLEGTTRLVFGVFVRDRLEGTTERVSVASDGETGDCSVVAGPLDVGFWHVTGRPSISADGRFVAFPFCQSNLVPGDTNLVVDIYVRDRLLGTTEIASLASDGTQSEWDCLNPSISNDGRHVAFWCEGMENPVPHDGNPGSDIFVRDRLLGTTEVASVTSQGAQIVPSFVGIAPAISGDARHVVFHSHWDFAGDGREREPQVYIRDRGTDLGVLPDLSVAASGPVLQVQGRATFSGAEISGGVDPENDGQLGAEELGAEIIAAAVLARPEEEDLAVRIRVSSLPRPIGGLPGVVYGLSFAADGTDYEIRGVRTSAGSEGDPHFVLMRCEIICTEQARLRGSFGFTGPEAFVSVPLELLDGATELRSIRAFTAPGDIATGALVPFDELSLPDAPLAAPLVQIGLAPAGTTQDEVSYTHTAQPEEGRFSVTLPTPPPGNWHLYVRACLGLCSEPVVTGVSI